MNYPKNYKKLTSDEQKNIFAGSISLPVGKVYLKKNNCTAKAKALISSGKVTGMTVSQVAQEIFAHAYCYYAADALTAAGINGSVIAYLKKKGKILILRTVEILLCVRPHTLQFGL